MVLSANGPGLGGQLVLGVVGAIVLLIGLIMLRGAWRNLGLVRRIVGDDADPIDIAAVSGGPSAVEGTARRAADGTVPAPFSDEDAVIAVGETLNPSPSGETQSLTTDERVVESVPFVVEDGTGSILVEPTDATLHLEGPKLDPADVDDPARDAWLGRTEADIDSPTAYRQRLLTPGEDVYVFGEAVATDGMAATGGERAIDWRLTGGDDLMVSTEGRGLMGGSNLLAAIVFLVFGGMFTLMGIIFLSGLL